MLYFSTTTESSKMVDRARFSMAVSLFSVIAALFSLAIIVTLLKFPEMRNKIYFQCILYMSLADLGTSIVSAFGFPQSGSVLCWTQGILVTYFPLASWFWTTALSYAIFSTIRGEPIVRIKYCHIFCWLVPLVCAFLPISTNNYGSASVDFQWCILVNRKGSVSFGETMWIYLSFFGWFFLCVGLMLYWTIFIFQRLVWQQTASSVVISRIYSKLWLYPVAMFVCWFFNYVIIITGDLDNPLIEGLSMLFGILNGVLSSLIFFLKSGEARSRWRAWWIDEPVDTKTPAVNDIGNGNQSGLPSTVRGSTTLLRTTIVTDFEDDNVRASDADDLSINRISMFEFAKRDKSFTGDPQRPSSHELSDQFA